ncbi:MAG: hypothetical protein L0I62_06230 [Gammaproteobacteria bacterium]|nr:hypothetical protein [Gammaproteobacteria bacterium]
MDTQHAAQARRRECLFLCEAYSNTIKALAPANWVLVVGAALLSLAAGTTILTKTTLITTTVAGILALISGALTIIHTKLGCDSYQAECKKLLSFYRGLAVDYDNLRFIPEADRPGRFSALNDQFSASVKHATASPFKWARRKAHAPDDAQA